MSTTRSGSVPTFGMLQLNIKYEDSTNIFDSPPTDENIAKYDYFFLQGMSYDGLASLTTIKHYVNDIFSVLEVTDDLVSFQTQT